MLAMKSLLCLLGLIAVATAMVDNTNHMYRFHAESAKHVQASEARYHAADKTALWRAPNYNGKDVPRMFDISISAACRVATLELVRLYQTCSAFQAGAALFQSQTTPTQNEVNAYCGAACKQDFENYATSTFVQSCSAAEILQIEINDARNTSNPDPFKFFKLLFTLRQPCVRVGTEWCLPTWFELTKTFTAGSQPTAAQLEGVCKPCLKAFLVEWVKWASIDQIRQFAFVDVLCTRAPKRDGTRAFCIVEFNEVEAMADGIPKISRMCSTRCYQKIIVKTWLAKGDLTPQERNNMTVFFKALDIFCAVNARGEYCGVEMKNFDNTLAPAVAACQSSFNQNTCSDGCRVAARTFYNTLGCCFTSFLNSEKEFNPDKTDGLQLIENFIRGTCSVPTPRPCRKWGKVIAARIVIRNLAFAYYVAYTRVVRAAILADLAMELGARQNQVVITTDPTAVAAQSDKMGVMAEPGVTFNVQISADGNDDPTAVQSDFANDLSAGNLNLLQTSQLTTLESRPNPALGMSIDTSASSTSLIDDPDNSASGSKLSIFAVLAAIVVGLTLRA